MVYGSLGNLSPLANSYATRGESVTVEPNCSSWFCCGCVAKTVAGGQNEPFTARSAKILRIGADGYVESDATP